MSKVLKVYIFYDLDAWPRNRTNTFKFKNCSLSATGIVKNSDNKKYVYFGVDNSSSSHYGNLKNNFLILGEDPTFRINGSFGSLEKTFSINFTKANTKFRLSLHYNTDNSYFLLMEKKSLNLKPTIKILTFQLNFVSDVYLMDLKLLSLEK